MTTPAPVSSPKTPLAHTQAEIAHSARRHPFHPVRLNGYITLSTVWAAMRHLMKSDGADTPGVDGVRLSDLSEREVCELVNTTWLELFYETYTPGAQRRVHIDKEDGGVRTLFILTIKDRLVQYVLLLLLGPIAEAHFQASVFGGRPGKSDRDLVNDFVRSMVMRGSHPDVHFVKVDVRAFFDRVPHKRLESLIRTRVRGDAFMTPLMRQLRRWQTMPGRGVAQGAPLSPLLANMFLGPVDDLFAGDARVVGFRWVDDIFLVILGCADFASSCLAHVLTALDGLGLEASPHKTVVTAAEAGVDFVGLNFKRVDGRYQITAAAKKVDAKLKLIDDTIKALRGRAHPNNNKLDGKKRRGVQETSTTSPINEIAVKAVQDLCTSIQAWSAHMSKFDLAAVYKVELHLVNSLERAGLLHLQQQNNKELTAMKDDSFNPPDPSLLTPGPVWPQNWSINQGISNTSGTGGGGTRGLPSGSSGGHLRPGREGDARERSFFGLGRPVTTSTIIGEPAPIISITRERVAAVDDVGLGELYDRVQTEINDTFGPQLNLVQQEISSLSRRAEARRAVLAAGAHDLAKRVSADSEHQTLLTIRRHYSEEATSLNDHIAILHRTKKWTLEEMATRRATRRTSQGLGTSGVRRAHRSSRVNNDAVPPISFYPGPPRE